MEDNSKKNNMDNKMTDIVIMGESLVEIMRDKVVILRGHFQVEHPQYVPLLQRKQVAR